MKIEKEFVNGLRRDCKDYVHKNNSGNMRERFCFLMEDGSFVSIEGNTGGWFIENNSDCFSRAVYWVMAC